MARTLISPRGVCHYAPRAPRCLRCYWCLELPHTDRALEISSGVGLRKYHGVQALRGNTATALKLAEIYTEAGLPDGVFNVALGMGETALLWCSILMWLKCR